MLFLDTDVPKGDLARFSPTKSLVTLSLSLIHVSWIFLLIGTDEDILKKSIKNYRFGQCQQIVLTGYYVGFALHDYLIHNIVFLSSSRFLLPSF